MDTKNQYLEYRPNGDSEPGVRFKLESIDRVREVRPFQYLKHVKVFMGTREFPEGIGVDDMIPGGSPGTFRSENFSFADRLAELDRRSFGDKGNKKTLKPLTIALRNFLRKELNLPEGKLNYDIYTGCSMCPCSPGWKLRGDLPDRLINQKVYVTAHYLEGTQK